MTRTVESAWIDVCAYDDLLPERGVCALLGGHQVAIFRTHEGDLHAVSNYDPFSGAFVLSRGLVGTRGGTPTVASPMHKHVFDLRTGVCLDDRSRSIRVFRVRTCARRVEVARP